jgi:hypothetical protein
VGLPVVATDVGWIGAAVEDAAVLVPPEHESGRPPSVAWSMIEMRASG